MEEKKRLKIGIFIDSFYPSIDGVVLVVDNLAKELSKYNDVTVVAPYEGKDTDDSDREYKVIRVNSLPIPFSEYRFVNHKTVLSQTFNMLLEEHFDIIHIHSPFNIGQMGLKIAKTSNIPCIATMHTRFDFELRKRIKSEFIIKQIIKRYIKVYNACDKCIAVNHAMIGVFKKFGYKHKPIVIYNGTDLKESHNKQLEKEIEIKYDIKDNIPLFLFVGRIIDIKNIFFTLDSLKLLNDEGYNFKMIFVGVGPDEKHLANKITEYNLNDKVIMTGKITDREEISAIYKRADLFLFPSIFDASSLVQIEAAVNKTPGLFIKGSVTADTILNDVNGFTSKLDNIAFKNRIKEIIENNDKLKEVANNAKAMLGKSWQDIAYETYNLYLKEITKKQKP